MAARSTSTVENSGINRPRARTGRTGLPQFRLRTLFGGTALLALLFAVMVALGPAASIAMVLVGLLIGLHVAGNALGTALRDQSPGDEVVRRAAAAAPPRPALSEVSRLSQHKPLGWINRLTTIIGAAVGYTVGMKLLADNAQASLLGAALGGISSGILGGLFGFLSGSFITTILEAWQQAIRDPAGDDSVSPNSHKLPPPAHPIQIPPALVADMDAG